MWEMWLPAWVCPGDFIQASELFLLPCTRHALSASSLLVLIWRMAFLEWVVVLALIPRSLLSSLQPMSLGWNRYSARMCIIATTLLHYCDGLVWGNRWRSGIIHWQLLNATEGQYKTTFNYLRKKEYLLSYKKQTKYVLLCSSRNCALYVPSSLWIKIVKVELTICDKGVIEFDECMG